ncbi:MAG: hypothetical protein J07HQX50_01557 [Haloquadratum sp. J07HQX50]|nr:MAG: hypothetical protein J07HQX50_01557 [Haloquadratum sp. J07HQX50]
MPHYLNNIESREQVALGTVVAVVLRFDHNRKVVSAEFVVTDDIRDLR